MRFLWMLLLVLALAGCGRGDAALDRNAGWRNSTNAHFRIVFHAIGEDRTELPPLELRFRESGRDEVVAFLQKFPLRAGSSTEGVAANKKHRYIRNAYDRFRTLYHLGEEEGPWQGKLFCITSVVDLPGDVAGEPSPVFQVTKTLYGDPTFQKFRYLDDGKPVDSGLTTALWDRTAAVVMVRSVYDEDAERTVSVLEFWAPEFLKTHDPLHYR
ncbi:MAG: hypothetical protein HY319_09510 [Armatimonadetes bacterium]|nr:hypothetical protein [Armatimonadota bacterium]